MREMGAAFAEFEALGSASIAALTKAVIAELQLGVPADTVTLTVVGAHAPLRSSLTLAEAIDKRDLKPRDELIAKIHPPVAAAAAAAGKSSGPPVRVLPRYSREQQQRADCARLTVPRH